jgi:hypothetical protein
MVAELLTGSMPPAEFFNPIPFAIVAALYGSGAILARELTVRWHKGWPTLLTLGAAYGIVEEGLMVKSFFDPAWPDLGSLGSCGRWGGVNWVWSVDLTLFHMVFSIAIPVLLVTLMFPERPAQPWVDRRWLVGLASLLAADVALGFAALTPYRPPLVPYAAAGVLVGALVWIARGLPLRFGAPATIDGGQGRTLWLVLFGFGTTVGFFAIAWALPSARLVPVVPIGLALAWAAGSGWLVLRLLRPGEHPEERLLPLAAGALGFFILLAPLQQLDASRKDNTAGMALVGLAAAGFLIWLARRARRATGATAEDART